MKSLLILLALVFTKNSSFAAGPFETGCVKAATKVLCQGYKDCTMGFIMATSKKGNNSEKGGYDECKEFANYVKSQSLPLDAKKAIARLQTKIASFNKDIKKDFPFLTLTADFGRLELEHKYKMATFMDHYGRDKTEESPIVGLASSDSSQQFELHYLNDLKSALYNVGKDDAGKQAMKAKFQTIKLGLYSHNASARSPEIKIVDKVLIVSGVFTIDNNMYTGEVQKFLETKL